MTHYALCTCSKVRHRCVFHISICRWAHSVKLMHMVSCACVPPLQPVAMGAVAAGVDNAGCVRPARRRKPTTSCALMLCSVCRCVLLRRICRCPRSHAVEADKFAQLLAVRAACVTRANWCTRAGAESVGSDGRRGTRGAKLPAGKCIHTSGRRCVNGQREAVSLSTPMTALQQMSHCMPGMVYIV